MKNFIIILFFVPLFLPAMDFSIDYKYDYYYFDRINYFSSHTLTPSVSSESGFVKFYGQFYGKFYQGSARYIIPYPDVDSSLLTYFPKSIDFQDKTGISQIYLSFYLYPFNLKIGKFPVKWGVSEIYSPADIFGYQLPFNIYTIQEGINCVNLSYTLKDFTLGFFYEDGEDYKSTKQGCAIDYMNGFFSSKLYGGHFFKQKLAPFTSDSIENYLVGFSSITDMFGPGLWGEADLFIDERNKRLYIDAGTDYTLFEKVYLMGECFLNFAGGNAPYDDMMHISKLLNREFLMGKWYIFLNSSVNIIKYFDCQAISVVNLDDYSSIDALRLKYYPKNNFDISLTGLLTTGNGKDEFFRIPYTVLFEISYSFR